MSPHGCLAASRGICRCVFFLFFCIVSSLSPSGCETLGKPDVIAATGVGLADLIVLFQMLSGHAIVFLNAKSCVFCFFVSVLDRTGNPQLRPDFLLQGYSQTRAWSLCAARCGHHGRQSRRGSVPTRGSTSASMGVIIKTCLYVSYFFTAQL